MSTQDYDSNFVRQMQGVSAGREKSRLAQAVEAARGGPAPNVGQHRIPTPMNTSPDETDPTREIRGKQANLCEAVMMRVVELETAANAMLEVAKKLRAAVVANT